MRTCNLNKRWSLFWRTEETKLPSYMIAKQHIQARKKGQKKELSRQPVARVPQTYQAN